MAGIGPAPKDPSKRARRNKDGQFTVIETKRSSQPALVDALGEVNPVTNEPWSRGTLALWDALGEFPTSDNLQSAQWMLLARAMILDDALLRGQPKYAAEARLQLQKFGIAPDDVARLRIQFAAADEADEKRSKPKSGSSRQRRGPLKAV